MITRNREGLRDFDIREDWHADREPGLSAMMRIKDEETWVALAIESILDWCDEIVIALQPCSDRTPEIVQRYADRPNVRVVFYPFMIAPMGPSHGSWRGHASCPDNSVHASAYFYNWTLAQTTRSHVLKWDGDMVAMDWLGRRVRSAMDAGRIRVRMIGTDIVGDELRHVGNHPLCPTDGVLRVIPSMHYYQGDRTQKLSYAHQPDELIEGAFLHFKWARCPLESVTKQWPDGWEDMPHFQRIVSRREPVAAYDGEYPRSVGRLLGPQVSDRSGLHASGADDLQRAP